MSNNITLEQEALLYSKLTGDLKRDYYVDVFASRVCFALKQRRKELSITQADVAKSMGVKQSYVSKIENFEKVPTVETIARYCYALHCPLDIVEDIQEQLAKQGDSLPQFSFSGTGASKKWGAHYKVPALSSVTF